MPYVRGKGKDGKWHYVKVGYNDPPNYPNGKSVKAICGQQLPAQNYKWVSGEGKWKSQVHDKCRSIMKSRNEGIKLSKTQLRSIIREEIRRVITEKEFMMHATKKPGDVWLDHDYVKAGFRNKWGAKNQKGDVKHFDSKPAAQKFAKGSQTWKNPAEKRGADTYIGTGRYTGD